VKLYSDEEYSIARANAVVFRSGELLRIPQRLGYSDRDRIVAFERLPGQPLMDRFVDSSIDAEILRSVALALAELHAQAPAGRARRTRESELRQVLPLADLVSFLCPQLAPRVYRLAHVLCNAKECERFEPTAIHGDFTPRQVLLGADTVGLVDFGFNSTAALTVAAFSHAYIWVHFYATEKPDMEFLYDSA
jgi:Ser/Thr protein kinase RdoA (MazF antagonist)